MIWRVRLVGWGLTFLAVLSLVARVAGAGARDADAVAPAVDVDALAIGHVALRPLPPAEAKTAPPGVLTVPAAQHGAGGWGGQRSHGLVYKKVRGEGYHMCLH